MQPRQSASKQMDKSKSMEISALIEASVSQHGPVSARVRRTLNQWLGTQTQDRSRSNARVLYTNKSELYAWPQTTCMMINGTRGPRRHRTPGLLANQVMRSKPTHTWPLARRQGTQDVCVRVMVVGSWKQAWGAYELNNEMVSGMVKLVCVHGVTRGMFSRHRRPWNKCQPPGPPMPCEHRG